MAAKDAGARAYRLCPATSDDVKWMARLEGELYSPRDAIPFHVLAEWYAGNPNGFNVVRRGDENIGHVDVLPIRPAPLRRLLDGKIVERDIRGEDLYSPGEKGAARSLYVESVAVRPRPGLSGAPAVAFILENFDAIIARVCEPSAVENVYAIAASGPGEGLMRRLGFARTGAAENRLDGHELWGATLADIHAGLSALMKRRGQGPAPR